MDKPKWIVVNFSGGKDSTAMLLNMLKIGEHIDEVICCDTGKEFPAMYRHISKIQKVVEDSGVKFTVLKADHSFDEYMFQFQTPSAKREGRFGKAWPTAVVRWCTGEMKRDVTKRYLRKLNQAYDVIECDGIAFDEQIRLQRKNQQQSHKRHPLVEWEWTERDCLQYCYDLGYDWEGLYEILDRVSCWCCPLATLENVRKLYYHFPELWVELKEMDERAWNDFKFNTSVRDLEVRFELEKEFEEQGKSIRSREFFTELKKRLS